MDAIHVYHNGRAYTYIVFGPYRDGFDVEVHKGHVYNNSHLSTYLFTQSGLERNTHIVRDMWDHMNDYLMSIGTVL